MAKLTLSTTSVRFLNLNIYDPVMAHRSDVATHSSLSLPSFAQAFSASSINSISTNGNALPPIQSSSRPTSPGFPPRRFNSTPLNDELRRVDRNSRKRSFRETSDSACVLPLISSNLTEHMNSTQSPVRIKEEPDREDLSHSTTNRNYPPWSANEAPVPSSTKPFTTTKRRRVTISGINTDIKRPSSSDANTPISPVVMGFTIMRDDPSAIEQVRSMLNVKQQQKALIEQRRGSNAELPGTASPMTGPHNVVNAPTVLRRSPTIAGATNPRRMTTSSTAVRSSSPPSTSTKISTQQQPLSTESNSHTPVTNVLPQPPISFAHRRAARLGAKSKPADILISPRETQLSEQMQPSIMSAPPISQSGAAPGRFSMALPSLPQAVVSSRLTASIVPPTPTRLGGPRTAIPTIPGPQISMTGRSPPAASVPISSTFVPPTPASLHRPSYMSEKTAFLAPFESFYDALADSKQLKTWLAEQLQKSNGLISSLQKYDNIEGLVEALVDKKVLGIREEVYTLRRRVDELETELRVSQESGNAKGKGRATDYTPEASDSYTFPPVPAPAPGARKSEYTRRLTSPSRADASAPGSKAGSPAPLEGRQSSASSSRFDSRPEPPASDRSQHHNGFPPALPPPPMTSSSSGNKISRSPKIHRSHSNNNTQAPPLSGHRKASLMEIYRETPEDLNFGDKRSGRDDVCRRRDHFPPQGRQRSGSSGESS